MFAFLSVATILTAYSPDFDSFGALIINSFNVFISLLKGREITSSWNVMYSQRLSLPEIASHEKVISSEEPPRFFNINPFVLAVPGTIFKSYFPSPVSFRPSFGLS